MRNDPSMSKNIYIYSNVNNMLPDCYKLTIQVTAHNWNKIGRGSQALHIYTCTVTDSEAQTQTQAKTHTHTHTHTQTLTQIQTQTH